MQNCADFIYIALTLRCYRERALVQANEEKTSDRNRMQPNALFTLRPDHAPNKHGFTLIELSIALVIIALVVGGVMVGKELIRAAEIRKPGRLIEQFDSAVNAFRMKYNCLPGDCRNATSFGFSGNGSGNGAVGDTVVNGGSIVSYNQNEWFYFFKMLIDAGLLPDRRFCTLNNITCTANVSFTYTFGYSLDLPTKACLGYPAATWMVDYTAPFGMAFRHSYIIAPGISKGMPSISADAMRALDDKFDDGYPLTGVVIAQAPQDGGIATGGAYCATTCINNGTTPQTYQNSIEPGGCTLSWRAGF